MAQLLKNYEKIYPLSASLKSSSSTSTHTAKNMTSEILQLAGIDQRSKEPGERGACIHCLRHLFVMKAIRQLEEKGRSIYLDDLLLPTYLGHPP
jgi:integrase